MIAYQHRSRYTAITRDEFQGPWENTRSSSSSSLPSPPELCKSRIACMRCACTTRCSRGFRAQLSPAPSTDPLLLIDWPPDSLLAETSSLVFRSDPAHICPCKVTSLLERTPGAVITRTTRVPCLLAVRVRGVLRVILIMRLSRRQHATLLNTAWQCGAACHRRSVQRMHNK